MARKLRVALIFGGRSVEHEVSLTSARSVLSAIDSSRYEVLLVGVTRDGRWLSGPQTLNLLESGAETGAGAVPSALLADPNVRGLVPLGEGGDKPGPSGESVDVVMPLIHGRYGEDGSLQGLLEMAGLPYVGCGVLASALCMDKVVSKRLLQAARVRVVEYACFEDAVWLKDWDNVRRQVEDGPGIPCFVKPANGGSSVGIVKVKDVGSLKAAFGEAGRYDRKILVERAVDAREIEVSVLGNEKPEASIPGEVVPANEFYDYDAKYLDQNSRLQIPADLSDEQTREVRRMAVEAFKALGCEGMARVDFLIDRNTGSAYVSEINTLPGFTPISMYPKLWEASGLQYPRLIDRLIELARERNRRNAGLETRYEGRTRSLP
ncbi:MAG: D-alanine--D-alanine ligase family protein [Acidobacteriota bacterium]|nr:D-alanine--D-alanine ligase [Acidobacteriota bacterium]